jgi:hypothetical protein
LTKPSVQAAARPPIAKPSAYRAQYGVIVICRDEKHQRRVYNSLKRAGLACKVVTT